MDPKDVAKIPATRLEFTRYRDLAPDCLMHTWDYVMECQEFWTAPGSDTYHHNWPGGLSRHTLEVMQIALKMADVVNCNHGIIVLGALWHDIGKVVSYRLIDVPDHKRPVGLATPMKKFMGGHLSRSYSEFLRCAYDPDYVSPGYSLREIRNLNFCDRNSPYDWQSLPHLVEAIAHVILAHHGERMWGSPAQPQIPEAWLVHLADQASARCMGGEEPGAHNKK